MIEAFHLTNDEPKDVYKFNNGPWPIWFRDYSVGPKGCGFDSQPKAVPQLQGFMAPCARQPIDVSLSC